MLSNINTILSLSHVDKEGKKYSPNDILMKYVKENDDNLFVSFTKINKLGINPKTKYNTPLGIYCYPIKLAYQFYNSSNKTLSNNINKEDVDNRDYYNIKDNDNRKNYLENIKNLIFINRLPFATDGNYFHIFRYNSNKILTVNKSKFDYKNYIEKLAKYVIETYDQYITEQSRNNIEGFIRYNIKDLEKEHTDPTSILYHLIMNIGRMIINLPKIKVSKYPLITNSIFRYLGIDGIIDPGEGLIHPNEPCQAVFFSKNNIEVLESFDNYDISSKSRKSEEEYNNTIIDDKNLVETKKQRYNIDSCDINNSNLKNIQNIHNIKTSNKSNFINCKINGGYGIKGGFISDSDVGKIEDINGVEFNNSKVQISNLNNCYTDTKSTSEFHKVNSIGCTFYNSDIIHSTINKSNLINCNINYSHVSESKLERCSISNKSNIFNSEINIYDIKSFIDLNNSENVIKNSVIEFYLDDDEVKTVKEIKSNKNVFKNCIFNF